MRPSAAQLLQHERLELVFKVAETEKMCVDSCCDTRTALTNRTKAFCGQNA
jgi:hypothetical protein